MYITFNASLSVIFSASSTGEASKFFVILPCPIPSVIEFPLEVNFPFFIKSNITDPSGSAATVNIFLFFFFKAIDTPASVPPVPTEVVKASIFPSRPLIISGPVVTI